MGGTPEAGTDTGGTPEGTETVEGVVGIFAATLLPLPMLLLLGLGGVGALEITGAGATTTAATLVGGALTI